MPIKDPSDDNQINPDASSGVEAPTTYYFISDLHIGGDGALDQCDFEAELIAFLRRLADGPHPAELIIIGDAFGLWELTEVTDDTKIERIARTHRELFEEFREAGRRIRITLVPGNHDYELACVPAYKEELAQYNTHIISILNPKRILLVKLRTGSYGSSMATNTMRSTRSLISETAMACRQAILLRQSRSARRD
jgi:hypothetical protein